MSLTKAEVEHVAMLARLALTDDEVAMYTTQLNAILDYAQRLEALDTSAVAPTAHVFPLHNVFRDDVVRPSMEQAKIVANAPEEEDGFFRVPRIV
ncbi:Asp-tRNA(Asn)/Glu-tRNA(Gln) amidotransferase subunit GatC [Heliophilum fasciatum]|uniref:Aspartyl/glutamyl-tRNA(Asn/Gln) amidotransferase subunit C n=1 Tax=Heliophilum fasciatum TaxID=35700 RepID=A0A4R2S6U0_9FIRM|nr:Asp-tRNA(Asn)/Glu-tRNA(Gln) amidotransferase subunit GatC [Heliophilum fasciatum]MCW2277265.1 aspartyl-tRNA(Asn)/glutamyl-tRNA(Gln) amidotransferase subunit C [Heliophilum fasciatum]TCP68101.1 aspartyl/glutamyl-tRNA(Asn/Gln) amidotransferase subunit C [Heliophilum fasciatum]